MVIDPVTVPGSEIPNGTDPKPEIGKTPATGEIPVTTQASIDDAQKEIERLKADLKKVHAESAGHRQKANELDKLKADLEATKLSDTEKLQKQLADVQALNSQKDLQLQEERNQNALERAARRVGIVDDTAIADAIRLTDTTALEHDEQGKPTNADDLMKQLIKSRPWLISNNGKQAVTSGGATNPSRSSTGFPQALSKEWIASLKPADYAAMSPEQKTAISRWIADGGMMRHR